MKSIEELKTFYYDTLVQTLEKLEEQRKTVRKNIFMVGMPYTLLFILGFYFFGEEILQTEDGLSFMGAAYFGLGGVIYKYLKKDYTNSFKQSVIQPLILAIDENFMYHQDKHLAQNIFNRSDLFSNPDRLSGNDYVEGEVDDVHLSFSDLHAERKSKDSKGRTRWTTIFKGLFLLAEFNKTFKGKTVVLPDTAQSFFGDFLGHWLQKNNLNRDELVKMDNPLFEKEFVVYSNDQIEARYILTPALMEMLLEFKHKSKYPIYVSFIGDHIHIAVYNNKDLFEPTVFSSLLDYEVAMQYIQNLHLAMGMINDLKLNERLWSKQ